MNGTLNELAICFYFLNGSIKGISKATKRNREQRLETLEFNRAAFEGLLKKHLMEQMK